jgi:predicted nucleic acid-binding protein
VTRSSPRPVVVDPSALLERLLGSRRGAAVAQAVGDSRMVAPCHLDVELLNALRGLVRSAQVAEDRAAEVGDDLRTAPLDRLEIRDLIPWIWAWRENLSAYDAAYAALAEVLGCPLITADARLGRALAGSGTVVLV